MPAQCSDIPLQCLQLAIIEVGACFEPRNIPLIDARRFLHIDLSLSRGLPKSPESKADASLRAQPSAQHPRRIGFTLGSSSCCAAHGFAPLS